MKQDTRYNKDIAVVLCDCGGTLRNRLDFEQLREGLRQMSSVATVKCCSKFCQQKECARVMASICKTKARRVVIGACYQQNFQSLIVPPEANQSSITEGLLWCVNIREHCGWVTANPQAATDKAMDILAAAVRRVELAEPLKYKKTKVSQNVLVLGGGVAAMQTSVSLSRLGHQVILVTKGESLGGLAAKMPQLYAYVASSPGEAEALVRSRADELIRQIKQDKRISVRTCSFLKSVEGEFGNFTGVVNSPSVDRETVSAGAIVLAVGSAASLLEVELAKLIHNGHDIPKRIAIVMDVSGEQGRAVSAAALSAAELLVKRFGTEVKLYCNNIRVAATGLESLYKRVRQAGVVVVKYESPPTISDEDSKKVVRAEEPLIGKEVSEEFDLVLTTDNPAADRNDVFFELIEALRGGPEGALQPDNVWLLPTKTNRKGIFVVGSARGNSELRDAQTDGLATANQIHELLKNKQIQVLDDAAVVDGDKCVLCLTCMRICPHGAVSIDVDNSVACVSAVACQRCGICAAQCPANAIELPRYTQKEIAAEVGIELKTQNLKFKTVVFACENSAYPAATAAGINGSEYGANVRLIRVPCAGKVDSRQVLQTLECGAEKVLVLGCHPENCQYLSGSSQAAKRIERLNDELERAGISKERVVFGPLASVEPGKFLEYVKQE